MCTLLAKTTLTNNFCYTVLSIWHNARNKQLKEF